jgi:signal transduction histidine kinase/ActR/RegA family two-component response regulator
VTYERSIPYRDAGTRYIRANYVPHVEGGKVQGFFSLVSDVTASKQAEQDARFLADASAALAGLVDYESTLQKVARLAVPAFADWCGVDLLADDGTLKRVAIAHVDPAKLALVQELRRRFPPDPDAPYGVWHILRTGRSEMTPDITDEYVAAAVKDQEQAGMIRELGLRSYIGVPLAARGKVLGVLTFVAAESGRRYSAADLAVAEDLAHRAAVAIENARLYQRLRDADRRKDEFLAMLAHELRNPLAPIRNGLHVLRRTGTDPAAADRVTGMIGRQVEHLVRLVDDLLDVGRIMRGTIELRRRPVELAAVVARAVEAVQPEIDARGHRLVVELPPDPVRVDGDEVRLTQVVGNLLTNAAKYTDAGGTIRLTAGREDGRAVLRVADTGIGIAPDQLARIFDMFVQADRGTKRAQGGMGIGLTLVRTLVELHGGTVEAHSAGPGRGSEFIVRLPLGSEGGGRANGEARPADDPAQPRPPSKVLVVDDNTDAAESLAVLLRLQGHSVRVAHDGPAALELAGSDPPEVAFLDIGMPHMDGLELARRFRNDPRLAGVRLIALTGWGQEEDRRRTREAGFDLHLVKPAEPDVLHRVFAESPTSR